MTRCDELTPEELAKRLASLMFLAGPDVRIKSHLAQRRRIPGFCVICGSKLDVTWRATRVRNGKTEQFEADHSPEKLLRVDSFKKNHPKDELGMRNGFLLMPITQCNTISEQAWNAAGKLLRREAKEARSAPARAERASQERRQKAARRLGGE